MKAISTKYVGATDTRGARIIASDQDKNRVSIPYPHGLNNDDAHHQAAKALCDKMKWPGELIGGGTKTGNVFVFAPHGCLTQLEFDDATMGKAEALARRLGFGERVSYSTSSSLRGLFCHESHNDPGQRCIINTRELGLMFVQLAEDIK